ncbi:hypothetical protein KC340_g2368 [Hortaea werneckii]|nr:hypothetical protein KC342_g493 [Hortaea werneckii]KAI7107257.1 hypothetical protein KC339_g2522 [Hortaea werneckii]KAI7206784.1 hypothetical protein KC365_g16949 [Hortaea werneckii]KAI7334710.1 hypothetical protein KC340_g2368 [Hortaea werneckii]KAI7407454.1 hypothetical protein KC328_g534 [Hortaea werneckii]
MVPWSENQRTTTFLLFHENAEFSDFSTPDKVRIFNHLHSGERGENVTVKKLSEAFSRRFDERAAKGWAVVCDTDHPDAEEMERRRVLRLGIAQRIRDAVVTLGIEDGDNVLVASIERGESSRAAETRPAGSQNQLSRGAPMLSGSTTGVKRKTPPTNTKRNASPVASSSRVAPTHESAPEDEEHHLPLPTPAAPTGTRANMIPSVINVSRDDDGDDSLQMMHYNNILWEGTHATARTGAIVPIESQVYFLGGPVHRVFVYAADRGEPEDDDSYVDVMICRKDLCVNCSSPDEAGDSQLHLARRSTTNTDLLLGLPFVHSSDCDVQSTEEAKQNPDYTANDYGTKPRLMRFCGAPKGYADPLPEKMFSRPVQFNLGHGYPGIVKAMVCQKMYCRQCSSKKTVENALERDRMLVEGRGWWREGMDNGGDRMDTD